ncbi:MAG: hypothetical protein ACJ74F_02045 [Mycobacterium sp.]|jgi:hypothetical protein
MSHTIVGATDLPRATFGAVNPDNLEHFVAGSSSLRVIEVKEQACVS